MSASTTPVESIIICDAAKTLYILVCSSGKGEAQLTVYNKTRGAQGVAAELRKIEPKDNTKIITDNELAAACYALSPVPGEKLPKDLTDKIWLLAHDVKPEGRRLLA